MNRNYCDGMQRRDLLRMGAAGVFGMGLTLPQILAGRAQAAATGSAKPSRRLWGLPITVRLSIGGQE